MRKIYSGIYAIIHVETGRLYIGSAVDIAKRWNLHRHGLKNKKHHSAILQRAWDKYGESAFSFVILEFVKEKVELIKREQYWIDTSNCLSPNGFNICPTAGNTLGRRFSQNTLDSMSRNRVGRKPSDETKRKMSEAHKGVKKSDEHKKKIGDANKGKTRTPEHRAAVSRANSERVFTPEMRSRSAAATRLRYQKLREKSEQGHDLPEYTRGPDGQLIETFRTKREAAT